MLRTRPRGLISRATSNSSPEYLKINPKGRVPALVTDQRHSDRDAGDAGLYRAEFSESGLAPLDDAFAFAQVQSINSYLCATVHVAHAHKGRGYRWADDENSFTDMKRMVPQTMAAASR